jgi:transcription initiation factor TFIIB
MWRLRKWQIRCRVHSFVERNLAQAMRELDRLSDKAYIPDPVKEKAAVIYRKALDKGLVRGRTITVIVAASLYVACRTTGTPRTLREIAEASFEDKKDVARCYRLLLWHLKVQMPLADPLTYISKIATRTGISGQTQGLAIKILQEAKRKRGWLGRILRVWLLLRCILLVGRGMRRRRRRMLLKLQA